MEANGFRVGGTELEVERLSPALIEKVNHALINREFEGERVPEDVLRGLCSDCDENGLIGSGYFATACSHRMGWLVLVVTREGIGAKVRKPVLRVVA